MGDALTNPAVLTAIFAAFGGAIAWLWSQIKAEKTRSRDAAAADAEKHRKCELELVTVKAEVAGLQKELGVVQGTCSTLTELLRKEIHLG